jgi:ABC-type transporter Mla MlaB component
MPWTSETGPQGPRLVLTGAVDIFEAAALHKTLVDLASAPGAAEVGLRGCTDMDSSVVQLLLAFERARQAGGQSVRFAGQEGRVRLLLSRFGVAGAAEASPPAAGPARVGQASGAGSADLPIK